MSKKIWGTISIIGILVAVVWAYQAHQLKAERVATEIHVRNMLQELESIDYATQLYEALTKEELLSEDRLSMRIFHELNQIFKEKKQAIGTEKDALLTEAGKARHKWTYSGEELLSRDMMHWIKDEKLNTFQKVDVVVSYYFYFVRTPVTIR